MAPPLASTIVGVFLSTSASSHNPVTTTVRFNREIARILNAKCVVCHSDGGMAMSLQGYEKARPWAEAIKDEVLARRMPPWPAERGYGEFANDYGLTLREQEFLISWIDGGVPEGDGQPPPFEDHSSHWMLGTPDAVHTAEPEFYADANASSRSYFVDLQLQVDTAIRAFDLKVADRKARAAFVFIEETGMYIGGWTPSQPATQFPEGSAVHLTPNSHLRVDIVGPGGAEEDPPQLGIYFAPVTMSRITELVLRGETNESGRARITSILPSSTAIIGFRLVASKDTKSVEFNARTINGEFKPILLIRQLRPDWPTPFLLRAPVNVPAGATLNAVGHLDHAALPTKQPLVIQLITTGAAPTLQPRHSEHQHSHAQ
jgi:hypothetical protein